MWECPNDHEVKKSVRGAPNDFLKKNQMNKPFRDRIKNKNWKLMGYSYGL